MPAILAAADAALRGTLGTNALNDGYLRAHAAATPDRVQIWHMGAAPSSALFSASSTRQSPFVLAWQHERMHGKQSAAHRVP